MNAPRIPDTAIRAATLAHHNRFCLSKDSDWHTGDDAEACVNDYRATTEIILAAALPLLGETTTQWGVQYTTNRETFTVRCRGAQHAASAARDMKLGQNQRAVSRSVITISGEWTEDTSE